MSGPAAPGVVAVTGANGFVGRSVVATLAAAGVQVRAIVRPGRSCASSLGLEVHEVGPGGWAAALAGCDQLVHLVARTHRLGEARGGATEAAYRVVNVDLTAEVLDAAVVAGLTRVVYMSSVKAMGESRDEPYTEADAPRPQDAYGRTKLAAEQMVLSSSLRSVVLRPPLVYGPGAAGNVARLARAVQRGVPLPLGRAHARRSLIGVGNLADAVRHVLIADDVAAGVYLLADTELLSVRQLVEALAAGCGRPARLLPLPSGLLRAGGLVLRRREEVDRLVRPLVLDTSRITGELRWRPPVAAADGLRQTARAVAAP